MRSRSTTGERLAAVFLLALVVFNPPLMSIFTTDGTLFGFPVLYLFMFAAWAGLIGLIVLGNRGRDEARQMAEVADDSD